VNFAKCLSVIGHKKWWNNETTAKKMICLYFMLQCIGKAARRSSENLLYDYAPKDKWFHRNSSNHKNFPPPPPPFFTGFFGWDLNDLVKPIEMLPTEDKPYGKRTYGLNTWNAFKEGQPIRSQYTWLTLKRCSNRFFKAVTRLVWIVIWTDGLNRQQH